MIGIAASPSTLLTGSLVAVPETMPFRHSLWGTPLPDNATVNAGSAPVVSDLVRESGAAKPMLNVYTWTAEHIVVPPDQPLVPVSCHSGDSHLNSMFASGVPIPDGTTPTNDSDSALIIWQPGSSLKGTYWEMQAARQDPSSGAWSCNFGGRVTNANGTPNAHYVQYVTGAAGTYQASSWGVQGSGLPYWPGVLSLTDCVRGYADHALLLEVYDARAGGHVWPASRSDGGAGSTNADYAICEGMRLRLPAGYAIPQAAHPVCQFAVQAARDYGLVITDRTLSGLALRAAPSVAAAGFLGGTADYDVLAAFPWSDLQLLAVGSDANQTPTG